MSKRDTRVRNIKPLPSQIVEFVVTLSKHSTEFFSQTRSVFGLGKVTGEGKRSQEDKQVWGGRILHLSSIKLF